MIFVSGAIFSKFVGNNEKAADDAGECSCGAKKGNKIVGGEEASVGF